MVRTQRNLMLEVHSVANALTHGFTSLALGQYPAPFPTLCGEIHYSSVSVNPHQPDRLDDLQVWYISMSLIACVNMCLMLHAYRALPSTSSYKDLMKDLAVPFVFQTSYRSWFPNQYTSRTVFWDTVSSFSAGPIARHARNHMRCVLARLPLCARYIPPSDHISPHLDSFAEGALLHPTSSLFCVHRRALLGVSNLPCVAPCGLGYDTQQSLESHNEIILATIHACDPPNGPHHYRGGMLIYMYCYEGQPVLWSRGGEEAEVILWRLRWKSAGRRRSLDPASTSNPPATSHQQSFWGLSFLFFGPVAALLFTRCYKLGIKPTQSNGMMTCAVLALFSVIYVPWEFKVA